MCIHCVVEFYIHIKICVIFIYFRATIHIVRGEIGKEKRTEGKLVITECLSVYSNSVHVP